MRWLSNCVRARTVCRRAWAAQAEAPANKCVCVSSASQVHRSDTETHTHVRRNKCAPTFHRTAEERVAATATTTMDHWPARKESMAKQTSRSGHTATAQSANQVAAKAPARCSLIEDHLTLGRLEVRLLLSAIALELAPSWPSDTMWLRRAGPEQLLCSLSLSLSASLACPKTRPNSSQPNRLSSSPSLAATTTTCMQRNLINRKPCVAFVLPPARSRRLGGGRASRRSDCLRNKINKPQRRDD